ncbi:MAG: hypothetical protein IPK71_37025 [Myxococcales bacterium]|nr:hypothetical protein [Myxococcales bacterium]
MCGGAKPEEPEDVNVHEEATEELDALALDHVARRRGRRWPRRRGVLDRGELEDVRVDTCAEGEVGRHGVPLRPEACLTAHHDGALVAEDEALPGRIHRAEVLALDSATCGDREREASACACTEAQRSTAMANERRLVGADRARSDHEATARPGVVEEHAATKSELELHVFAERWPPDGLGTPLVAVHDGTLSLRRVEGMVVNAAKSRDAEHVARVAEQEIPVEQGLFAQDRERGVHVEEHALGPWREGDQERPRQSLHVVVGLEGHDAHQQAL